MSIESHKFNDEDLSLREAYTDKIALDCDLDRIDSLQYIELNRDDVVEMAIHFNITADELNAG